MGTLPNIRWAKITAGWLGLAVCCALLAGCGLAGGTGPSRGNLEVGNQVGQLAPEIDLEDIHGDTHTLSELRGRVVLINFWATWCSPCRAEFPALQAAYERNQDQGFVVLAVNVQDHRQDVSDYARELGLTFPVLLDPLGRATGSYKARALPTSYVVDPEGVIVHRQVGPIDETTIKDVLSKAGVE